MPQRNYNSGRMRDLRDWCENIGGDYESDFDSERFLCSVGGGAIEFSPRRNRDRMGYDQMFYLSDGQQRKDIRAISSSVDGDTLMLKGPDEKVTVQAETVQTISWD